MSDEGYDVLQAVFEVLTACVCLVVLGALMAGYEFRVWPDWFWPVSTIAWVWIASMNRRRRAP